MGNLHILGGKIWDKDKFVANKETVYIVNEEDCIISLDDDDLITPGVIDFHLHLWSPATISKFGIEQEKYFAEGVIGGAEAGSFGCDNWHVADRFWRTCSNLKVKSFLSILPEGLAIAPPVNPTKPENVNIEDLVNVILNDKTGNILGTKVQLGWLNYKSEETDRKLLKLAREVADRTNTNIMVHISDECISIEETTSMLKKGDVITHVYAGFKNTILDKDGKVSKCVFDAAERGVLMDLGYAGKHFAWKVFKQAYSDGLKFDTMGTDMVNASYKDNSLFQVYDIFHMASGFLNYGVDLDEVFRALTISPANYLGIQQDITKQCLVLKKVYSDTELLDGMKESIQCKYEYKPLMFINNNDIILKSKFN